MNGSPHLNGSDSAASPAKRKAEDGAQPQQRTKRNRYISIACNECKRRKIKCNGQTPCQRCGNLSLECLYAPNCCNNFKDTDEFKRMDAHISSLQDQVDTLFKNLNDLRSHVDITNSASIEADSLSQPGNYRSISLAKSSVVAPTPPGPRRQSVSKHPHFRGPTSSAFNLDVAKSSLENMGITTQEDTTDEALATREGSPVAHMPQFNVAGISMRPLFHPDKDPIWLVEKEEAIRLCNVYRDEIGAMYQIVDIDHTIRHANLLYTFLEAANRNGLTQMALPGADGVHDDETCMLKLMLAVAMTLEGNGKSEAGSKMFKNVMTPVQALMYRPVDVTLIRLVAMTSMWYFHIDEESVAWRIIGQAARLCLELGLHRRETYDTLFATEEEKESTRQLFWSIYILDRRWSFGTGLPLALQDADIDPLLPRPHDSIPYLSAMVRYAHIGSRVWKSVANADTTTPISKEDIGYLDYQILQWLRSIPDSLKYDHPNNLNSAVGRQQQHPSTQNDMSLTRGMRRLPVVLYLRANVMRILIYRPVLHTSASILENLPYAQAVVDVAKDTIQVLIHVNQTSELYRTQQVLFNYFLISALAVLFLAVSHAPAQFAESCRDEFYMAVGLVRGFSADSFISKRLWKTVRGLKEVAPKLGLPVPPGEAAATSNNSSINSNRNGVSTNDRLTSSASVEEDPHSSAAVAMAGLAGHQVDESFLYRHHQAHPSQTNLSGHHQPHHHQQQHNGINENGEPNLSPNGVANDLTFLFEAAGGYAGLPTSNAAGNGAGGYGLVSSCSGTEAMDAGTVPGLWGHEDDLARIMRDLF